MQLDASKVNEKTDLKLELKKIASDKGFRIVDNEGSGNCMFFALSDQLEITMGIKIKHDELRQILVQYLKKNPKLVSWCLTLYVTTITLGAPWTLDLHVGQLANTSLLLL